MFCTHCGSQIKEGMHFCQTCGAPVTANAARPGSGASVQTAPAAPVKTAPVPAPQQTVSAPQEIPNYKGWLVCAIICTAAGWMLSNIVAVGFGVIAIIFAVRARKRANAGDLVGAKAAVKTTKALNITALILLVIWLLAIVVAVCVLIRVGLSFETPEGLQRFLSNYGYSYDLDLIRDYLAQ